MSIDLGGFFTKDIANTFQAEVVECPYCAFEFSTIHEQVDITGFYECPSCKLVDLEMTIQSLREENKKLKQLLEEERKERGFWP